MRELGEGLRIDGVLGDVDAFEAGVVEIGGATGEEGSVGRHRGLHRVGRPANNLFEILAQHRLAAGELHLLDAELRDDLQKPHHVVGGHLVVVGLHRAARVAEPLVVTVDTVEVTPVGQRDANTGDLSTEFVCERAIHI
ncbi:MAG: hypothetical protein U5L09_17965 [Bacteroidales bacterium]|nr:hypothetical protein [Bacteroidales bacterium]